MDLSFPATIPNDNSAPGTPALPKQYFGKNSRYAIAPVNTRFGDVAWFIWDAETTDQETERAAVLFQYSTREDAFETAERLDEGSLDAEEPEYEGDHPSKPRRTFAVNLRKTHRYVDAYKHLDVEEFVAHLELLQESKLVTDDEDPCEPTRIIRHVRVLKDEVQGDVPTIVRAIRDTLSFSGCGHEHDCCGCWHAMVTEVLQCERVKYEYIVISYASRNY